MRDQVTELARVLVGDDVHAELASVETWARPSRRRIVRSSVWVVRDLDELRAESGGVQFGNMPVAGGSVAAPSAGGDPTERLRRAKQMLDDGLISDTEYESIKARVVDNL